ncbi:hypothetical protein [Bradyrhizobium liaoningense]|uniref:hypothetical protein n=1 Tax=Bradyrhizobium liaoningense TaxID=43992 RepID=UPI001BADA262|nr:hypothetical protein [Bradyrhizobium liaoningense]MBR0719828.1 hypothetical protein [Bradyrhizobium liaoningense]
MTSTLDDKFAEEQIRKCLAEQFSSLVTLARDEKVGPLAPPTKVRTSRAPRPTGHRMFGWRYVAFIAPLLAASIGAAAWRSSPSVDSAVMAHSGPAALMQAAPNDVALSAVSLSSNFAQQLRPIARDFAALRQTVELLKVSHEHLVRDNENLASQLKASREEFARNQGTLDEIKATQIQMARENQTLTEQLNAKQEQLAHIIANASAPQVMPEEPQVMPEELKVSPGEPKAIPEIPLPRPRPSAHVAQMPKAPQNLARSQAIKPQSSLAWPWSMR